MSTAAALAHAPSHIAITPGVRGGQPRIQGTRITVSDIVIMHLRQAHSLEEIAGTYDLPLASVYAAMTYYYDHREAVDERMAVDRERADALEREHPSLLQAKLADAGRG